jgi:hydroxymethylpyrimidine pyrophosphatase-like HAD family hydrolase
VRYGALAVDYDGTLAFQGKVNDTTVDALRRARAGSIRLIMVTGRELRSLFNTFAHVDLFDRIVAENGALLFEPASQSILSLAPPPPPALVAKLVEANVPLSVGHTIVATVEPHEHAMLTAIHELGLEWHVIFNKGAVMALPANVTKATGLVPALAAVGVTPEQTIGMGDAENDHVFLRQCGLSVAVDNALPAVKETADVVTRGARGAGVIEIIDALLEGRLDEMVAGPKRQRA